MNKDNITKGKFELRFMTYDEQDDGECDVFIEAEEGKSQIGKIEIMMEDFGEHSGYPREQKLADAHFIVEAKKVFDETNQTPRELMEANKELLDAIVKSNEMLKDASKVVGGPQYGLLDIIARNRDLIKKHSTK